MTGLSTAQVRTLAAVAAASDREEPYPIPKGPSSRPAKFLTNTDLIVFREAASRPFEKPGGYWITAAGRAELARHRDGDSPA